MQKIAIAAGLIVILLLGFVIVWQADILGVPEGKLEQAARKRQEIDGSWEMVRALDEDMCAMLFYDEGREACAYSIYLSREGMSYGYFFWQGGTDSYIVEGVKGLKVEGMGIALLSLNRDKVCKIVVEHDTGEEEIPVDSNKPFVVVIPGDCGEITLYDGQNNIVTLYNTYTGI